MEVDLFPCEDILCKLNIAFPQALLLLRGLQGCLDTGLDRLAHRSHENGFVLFCPHPQTQLTVSMGKRKDWCPFKFRDSLFALFDLPLLDLNVTKQLV